MNYDFMGLPKIPQAVWDELTRLKRMQNGVLRAQLEILQLEPRQMNRRERTAQLLAEKVLLNSNCKIEVASSSPREAHLLMQRVIQIIKERTGDGGTK